MIRKITTVFLTGLTAMLPLIITLSIITYLAGMLFSWLGPGSSLGRGLKHIEETWQVPLGFSYPMSVLAVILFIYIVGYFARQFIGQRVGGWIDAIISRIPFINKIYNGAEQVVELFSKKGDDAATALTNVVIIRYANVRIVGMLANSQSVLIHDVPHFMVYIPNSPVPATGSNYLVPCADVEDINIDVEDMTRILVSLGSLGPTIMNSKPTLFLPQLTPQSSAQPADG